MPAADAPFLPDRLQELAARAEKTGHPVFSPFLTPPEAETACSVARKKGVRMALFGGYADAERQMAGFWEKGESCPPGTADELLHKSFPMAVIAVSWSRQESPSHRDLLGSVMALGIQRQTLGDIVRLPDQAYLFVQEAMAQYIADTWTQAGKARLHAKVMQDFPEVETMEGCEKRDTVASLRLDAIVSSGLSLSRSKAAELIAAGYVKLRHIQVLRGDAQVARGDVISVRGKGRLQLADVGAPTRKGRLPITVLCFGIVKTR